MHQAMIPDTNKDDPAEYYPTEYLHKLMYQAFTSENLDAELAAKKNIASIQNSLMENLYFINYVEAILDANSGQEKNLTLLRDTITGLGQSLATLSKDIAANTAHKAELYARCRNATTDQMNALV